MFNSIFKFFNKSKLSKDLIATVRSHGLYESCTHVYRYHFNASHEWIDMAALSDDMHAATWIVVWKKDR